MHKFQKSKKKQKKIYRKNNTRKRGGAPLSGGDQSIGYIEYLVKIFISDLNKNPKQDMVKLSDIIKRCNEKKDDERVLPVLKKLGYTTYVAYVISLIRRLDEQYFNDIPLVDLVEEGHQAHLIEKAQANERRNKEAKNYKIARLAKADKLYAEGDAESEIFKTSEIWQTYYAALIAYKNALSKTGNIFESDYNVIRLIESLTTESILYYDYLSAADNLKILKLDDEMRITINSEHANNVNYVGKGRAGTIYKSKTKNIIYKIINCVQEDGKLAEPLLRDVFLECWIQTVLSSDKVYGYRIPKIEGLYKIDSKAYSLCIVMEYIQHPLKDVVGKKLELEKWKPFLYNLSEALVYFDETYNFFHRDLHIGNLLWRESDDITTFTIIDFGYSRISFFNRIGKRTVYSCGSSVNVGYDLVTCDILHLLCSLFYPYRAFFSNEFMRFVLLLGKPIGKNLITDTSKLDKSKVKVEGEVPDIISWIFLLSTNFKSIADKYDGCIGVPMPYLVAAGYQGKCVFNDLIEMNAPLNIACLYPRRLLEATKDIDSYKIICDKDDEIGKFLENNPTIFL